MAAMGEGDEDRSIYVGRLGTRLPNLERLIMLSFYDTQHAIDCLHLLER